MELDRRTMLFALGMPLMPRIARADWAVHPLAKLRAFELAKTVFHNRHPQEISYKKDGMFPGHMRNVVSTTFRLGNHFGFVRLYDEDTRFTERRDHMMVSVMTGVEGPAVRLFYDNPLDGFCNNGHTEELGGAVFFDMTRPETSGFKEVVQRAYLDTLSTILDSYKG